MKRLSNGRKKGFMGGARAASYSVRQEEGRIQEHEKLAIPRKDRISSLLVGAVSD